MTDFDERRGFSVTSIRKKTLEESASLLSFLTYSFLDDYVWGSYWEARKDIKKHDLSLPELSYADQAQVLSSETEYTFCADGQPRKSLFRILLSLHLTEHIGMAVLLFLHVLMGYGAPLGLERVLSYLEHRPSPQSSPAPWLMLLFLGPVVAALLLQLYASLGARVAVRIEASLMAAVMRTGLRMRASANTAATQESGTVPPTSINVDSLLTTDVANIREARDWLLLPICVPLNIGVGIWFLYNVLGWSAFVGLGVVVLLFPVPGWFAARVRDVEVTRMQRTDARVEGVSEAVTLLRMIKLFGWERYILGRVETQREEELACIMKRRLLEMGKGVAKCVSILIRLYSELTVFSFLIPVATMLATYATYTLVMRQPLTPSKVFSSMAVFDILRGQFHLTFHTLSQVVAGHVSLSRVEQFLWHTELLDEYNITVDAPSDGGEALNEVIGFKDVSFTWSVVSPEDRSPKPFTLRIEGELIFPPDSITVVVGATGSGKTSLLMALLGEMHLVADIVPHPKSWFRRPNRDVAYGAQETWVLNESIRNNILFGSPYDEQRYRSVLQQCALDPDLALLPAGDATEVGEKGATLSGGQKARVTLARAVYSPAKVLLLDDVLAALDIHTTQLIIEKCFGGELMKGRTVVLVTHNGAMAKTIATHVVRMGHDGRIAHHGTINKVLLNAVSRHASLDNLAALVETAGPEAPNNDMLEIIDSSDPLLENIENTPNTDGKLIVDEEVEVGRVNLNALKLYLSSLGGKHYILFFVMFVGGVATTELLGAGQTWFLGYWASQYGRGSDVKVLKCIWYVAGSSSTILGCSMAVYMAAYVVYIYGGLRASHTTPTSRIISRCTQDIGAVDGVVTSMIQWLTELTISMLVKLGAIVFITPLFLGPGVAVTIFSGWLCQVYMTSQVAVKREMSNARAPIIGHYCVIANGLVSIRAYGAQDTFVREAMKRIDRYSRAARTFYNLTRWITIRLDFIGSLFTCSLATYLVYFQSSASNTGLMKLTFLVSFSGMILYWVVFANELELQERIDAYLRIDQEPKNSDNGKPPAYWPASGDLRVQNLSARYETESSNVLHDISFHVKPGEHVGIVGRTGSGKSSLALALLRSIPTTGEPEMLTGTLRQNLDPFDDFGDAHLNDALCAAGLFSLQSSDDSIASVTLDTIIASGQPGISVGQRQIIALARALVRGSKLLILDEDHQTELLIQSMLRHQLAGNATLLTIAHRIHTVMDADKIMVLDQGHIVEFDTPEALLRKPCGHFRCLVDHATAPDLNDTFSPVKRKGSLS
ncbi:P-loop containing nucleoside triphosphate hydrolase protein [Pholiota conissans]|uniref:P-loop containing nucleoside triphosphate hydrolase protein n=1 Tax=Pholiota conissans TaxID=109636 RepID=A0A9P5YYU5_9AGAR|nr:P-loop containing nucleoside triphosphate hydrolase protein [Pholiota conissans]